MCGYRTTDKDCEVRESLGSFLEELLVEEEDEQIDVDLCLVEHLHHRHALVLQLQQVLVFQQELFHLHAEESSLDVESSFLRSRNDVKNHVLKLCSGQVLDL